MVNLDKLIYSKETNLRTKIHFYHRTLILIRDCVVHNIRFLMKAGFSFVLLSFLVSTQTNNIGNKKNKSIKIKLFTF